MDRPDHRIKETIYESLKGKYIRVLHSNGFGVGLLKYIDYNKLILSPFIIGIGTEMYSSFKISNGIWVIPCEDIKGGIQEIEDGENYMKLIVDDSKIKNEKDIRFLLAEMKTKGIENLPLETRINDILTR